MMGGQTAGKAASRGLYLTLSHPSIRPTEQPTKGIQSFYMFILIYFTILDVIRLSKYSNLTFLKFYFHFTFKNNFPAFVKRLKFFCNTQLISIPPLLRVGQFVNSVITATLSEWQSHCKYSTTMTNEQKVCSLRVCFPEKVKETCDTEVEKFLPHCGLG